MDVWTMKTLVFMCVALSAALIQADDTIDRLQAISYTIKAGSSSGSGVAFTRLAKEDEKETVSFIHSAGHVVDGLRKTRTIIVDGTAKTVVEFDDAVVVQEFYEDGRRIGETQFDAKVIRYSSADHGEDLAVLQVRRKNFLPIESSVEFHDSAPPALGASLWHVGSLYGQFGSSTLSEGIVSKIGRVLPYGANGTIFDQVSVTAVGGSSGGGVFTKDGGKCIGLLVRGAPDGQVNFIVPVRRMRDWAKRAKVEWTMDRSVPMPSASDLRKLPIDEDGADDLFDTKGDDEAEFKYLIKREASK
jgi:hypothetical protein